MRERRSAGRPREFDEDGAVEKIMSVFWAKGFEGTALSDLMAATGLSKGSLYAAFGDKQAMYARALAYYEEAIVDRAAHALRDGAVDFRARINAFLSAPIDGADGGDRRGCFLCNAAADQASGDEGVAALVRRGFAKLERAASLALAEGAPSLALEDAAARARAILSVYAGLRSMARAGVDGDALRAAKDLTIEKFLEG